MIRKETRILPYMMFPKFLIDIRINETAKMLYMVLLDRSRISAGNAGWIDQDGHVFICYTLAGLEETLHKGKSSIEEALRTLEEKGLILRKRQGVGKPNRIYVKLPTSFPGRKTTEHLETDSSDVKVDPVSGKQVMGRPENSSWEDQYYGNHMTGKAVTNKNYMNKNDSLKTMSEKSTAYGRYQNVFLSGQEKEVLQENISNWEEYIERLSSYMASTGREYSDHAATIIHWAERDGKLKQTKDYSYEEEESL